MSLVDASLDPQWTIPGDGHPTPYAHRARAILLKRFLAANMPAVLE